MALTKGIHHIAIKAYGDEEYKQIVAFYRDVLGMPVYKDWKTGIMLDTGGGRMEIMNNAESRLPQGTLRHVAFETDDVDTCIAAVRTRDIRSRSSLPTLSSPPKSRTRYGWRSASAPRAKR